MDNASGGTGSSPASGDEQFTVPVPLSSAPTRPVPAAAAPRAAAPTVPVNPYAMGTHPDGPGWPTAPWSGGPAVGAPDVDPLLARIGTALFWVTVGWWAFVLVRVLGQLGRVGWSDTILIRNIDRYPEETVIAAVVGSLAAVVLLFGRGPRGRDVLGLASAALAVVTVAVAVWRVLP